jgi:hypothetical protein
MVVSEETGNLSLVYDGMIYYDLEQAEIRRMLRKSLDFMRTQKTAAVGETKP